MKKIIFFLSVTLLLPFGEAGRGFAQAPQSFKYQSVVRDATGALAVNRVISIRTSILAGSASGSIVYMETQTLSTNDYGVVSLNIGAGTVASGNFATISWGATTYFVKTELDINGGSTYLFMGTSQILSVPYALYAEKAGNSNNDHDTSATNELQNLSVVGNNLSISNGNTIALPPDADSNPTNELQNLSLIGDSLHISNGNAVYLSGVVDLDASPTNELQNLSLNNDTLNISMGNNVVFPHDVDRDTTNEIQSLSINQGTIHISKGNSISLPDSSITNELQDLSINQGAISISSRNSIHLPDSSATNELQNLSINAGTVSISNGNSITLPDASSTNELQNLSNNQDTISISQGNSIYINTTRSLKFPEGTDGIPVVLKKAGAGPIVTYTVPSGKNFYLTNKWDNQTGNIYGFPVFPTGTTISLTNPYYLCGVIVNQTSGIQIINTQVTNTLTYTVPSGKTFYLKSFGSGFKAQFINGDTYTGSTTDIAEILMFDAGTIIMSTGTSPVSISGYLK